MSTTIDAAGRIVIPKALRDAAGLRPGVPVLVRARAGVIHIEQAPTEVQLVDKGGIFVARAVEDVPPLRPRLKSKRSIIYGPSVASGTHRCRHQRRHCRPSRAARGLRQRSVICSLPPLEGWDLVRDPHVAQVAGGSTYDAQVLACARAGGARRFVTLNAGHYASLNLDGIGLVTP